MIREKEMKNVYELCESEYMEGYSFKHVLTGETHQLVFDSKTGAKKYAERQNWIIS
jgi:hypothetical protein